METFHLTISVSSVSPLSLLLPACPAVNLALKVILAKLCLSAHPFLDWPFVRGLLGYFQLLIHLSQP